MISRGLGTISGVIAHGLGAGLVIDNFPVMRITPTLSVSPVLYVPDTISYVPLMSITPYVYQPTGHRPLVFNGKENVTWALTPNNKRFTRTEA